MEKREMGRRDRESETDGERKRTRDTKWAEEGMSERASEPDRPS